jgi:hypothetical protein
MRGIFSFAIATLIGASFAFAAPPQLKGKYAFTGMAHCIGSSVGFNPDGQALCADTHQPISFQPNPGPLRGSCPGVFNFDWSIEGVRTFNGDGTGTIWGRTVSADLIPNAGSLGVSGEDFTSSFTYSFGTVNNATIVFVQAVPNSTQGNITDGPRAGQTFTLDAFSLAGLVSNNKQQLTLATVKPTVETQTFSNGDVSYRMCVRSRTLIWTGE